MVSVGWLGLHYYGYVHVHGKDIQFIKLYLAQTHATVDRCVSVFSTDMHSSSLGARPGGFLCRHKSSPQHCTFSLVPRPRFPTAADGLHHRYVESGYNPPAAVGNLGLVTRLLHKHHNLNNLGIRQIWQNLFGKIDFVF